jgi:hypothetical protein
LDLKVQVSQDSSLVNGKGGANFYKRLPFRK